MSYDTLSVPAPALEGSRVDEDGRHILSGNYGTVVVWSDGGTVTHRVGSSAISIHPWVSTEAEYREQYGRDGWTLGVGVGNIHRSEPCSETFSHGCDFLDESCSIGYVYHHDRDLAEIILALVRRDRSDLYERMVRLGREVL